jgi:hypothetical protein
MNNESATADAKNAQIAKIKEKKNNLAFNIYNLKFEKRWITKIL